MKLKTTIAVVLLMSGAGAYAHDFTATVDGQPLYFNITNKAKRTAAVTYNGSISDKIVNNVSGKVEIPAKVKHDNVLYEVTAINPKAFAGAKHLKGIVIPSGVRSIGGFAFEGCDSLTSVVFPGNPVTFGQGVFFKCTSISDVTIGSDWTSIDFTMFRWSDKLTEINITVKIGKIQGIKKLKKLTAVRVDSNNEKFAAHAGLLYSKDGKTLYACPRAYAGKVKITEGTETITPGALIDCPEVTDIDFPSTLKSLSFRETSRMKGLETIVMRPSAPVMTAYTAGKGMLMMQVANDDVSILISDASKKAYESELVTEAGEYSETPTGIPYMVNGSEMAKKGNLKSVKNFDN